MKNKRHTYDSGHPKGYKSSVPGTEDKDQIYLLFGTLFENRSFAAGIEVRMDMRSN